MMPIKKADRLQSLNECRKLLLETNEFELKSKSVKNLHKVLDVVTTLMILDAECLPSEDEIE